MSVDVDVQVQELRTSIEQAQRTRARQEAELDAARAREAGVLERLQTEYGVSSAEEAQQLLQSLESQVRTELEAVREGLRSVQA